MNKFFSVRVDRQSWTKDAIDPTEFTNRGYSVKPSRSVGEFDVFMDMRKVAILFASKAAAAAYVGAQR